MAAPLLILLACGNDRPPPSSGSFVTPTTGGGSSGTASAFVDGGVALPGCGAQDNGSYCDCVDTPLFADAPNMYFVLDRSGSMAEDDKWTVVRKVMAQILHGLGPRANFGATVFPGFEQTSCALAKQVLPLTPGDPYSATDGPVTRALIAATSAAPSGGTPTAQALTAVKATLATAKGKTFVILATDGGPNCNAGASCGFDQCQPNIENQAGCPVGGPFNCCSPPDGPREACLDAANTNTAVAALKEAGIPVYVVGLPGTAVYASLLDELATSGGTALAASPKYYKVASATDDALLTALKQIAAKIVATCDFKLKEAPADPSRVNVYFDEVVLPADPVNGWKLVGDTVTLVGTSCEKVLAGDVLDVRIIAGCPTVEPR